LPRIVGVDIPKDKRVVIALTYICGIGKETSRLILKEAKISEDVRAKDLTESEIRTITSVIEQKGVKVEGDIRRDVSQNIKRLTSISAYRGIRHRKGLPVRGQSSKTNARTRKGPKRTVAGKKKAPTSK